MDFRWNQWNLDHATRHGVSPLESQHVIACGQSRHAGDGKYIVRGRGFGQRFVQAVYLRDPDGTIYVIHARPMEENEKRRFRRRTP